MAVFHARSNSLPSRSNPFVPEIEEQLCRINSSNAASCAPSSSELYQNMSLLQDLYDSVEKLLLLPQMELAPSQEENRKWIDELCDGSLWLLDLCNTTKDALMQTKESTSELQSTIRRKIEAQETEVKKYLASRKVVKRTIKKAMQSLKAIQKRSLHSPSMEDQETVATATMLRDIEAATFSVISSLLSVISRSKARSKSTAWSLISKLTNNKRIKETENEFEIVDATLQSASRSENVQEKLKILDLCVQDLEESLEGLCKRLIKTRVSLLNILNH